MATITVTARIEWRKLEPEGGEKCAYCGDGIWLPGVVLWLGLGARPLDPTSLCFCSACSDATQCLT